MFSGRLSPLCSPDLGFIFRPLTGDIRTILGSDSTFFQFVPFVFTEPQDSNPLTLEKLYTVLHTIIVHIHDRCAVSPDGLLSDCFLQVESRIFFRCCRRCVSGSARKLLRFLITVPVIIRILLPVDDKVFHILLRCPACMQCQICRKSVSEFVFRAPGFGRIPSGERVSRSGRLRWSPGLSGRTDELRLDIGRTCSSLERNIVSLFDFRVQLHVFPGQFYSIDFLSQSFVRIPSGHRLIRTDRQDHVGCLDAVPLHAFPGQEYPAVFSVRIIEEDIVLLFENRIQVNRFRTGNRSCPGLLCFEINRISRSVLRPPAENVSGFLRRFRCI